MQTRMTHPYFCWRGLRFYVFLMVFFCLAITQRSVAVQSQSTSAGTYYSDCSSFTFRDFDSDLLTREEQLALLEQDLTENLNRSEACLSEAAQAAAERVAGAASGNGNGAGNGNGNGKNEAQSISAMGQGEEISAISDASAESATPQTSSAPSKKHVSGKNVKGSSKVCEVVRQGLAAATTEAETIHFQQLLREYGCAG